MVRTIISQGQFEVQVHVTRNSDAGLSLIANPRNMIGSDAFDYFTQALGYFRHAISTMSDAQKVTVSISRSGETVEETEITRDESTGEWGFFDHV